MENKNELGGAGKSAAGSEKLKAEQVIDEETRSKLEDELSDIESEFEEACKSAVEKAAKRYKKKLDKFLEKIEKEYGKSLADEFAIGADEDLDYFLNEDFRQFLDDL